MGRGTVQLTCMLPMKQMPSHLEQGHRSPAARLMRCAHIPGRLELSSSLVADVRSGPGAQACWCRGTVCCSAHPVMLSNPGCQRAMVARRSVARVPACQRSWI